MKLSTRGRYGTRVLLDLALRNDKEPVPLKEIAQRQQISVLYMEHIITPLITAGIIRSTRGARGGIQLIKPPQDIKLSEVMGLLEGSIAPVDCINDPKVCQRSEVCATRDIWIELKKAMDEVLESKTLMDLVEMQKKKEPTELAMYDI
jgi:Rrf2 family transcriptional regulator, cysteine metabolism repressor